MQMQRQRQRGKRSQANRASRGSSATRLENVLAKALLAPRLGRPLGPLEQHGKHLSIVGSKVHFDVFTHVQRQLLVVAPVARWQDDRVGAGAACGQHLFLDAAHWQHLAR